jgi:hypothetical protein
MELPTAFVLGVNAAASDAYSARPDAPVVPEPEPRRRTREVRLSVSRVLHWAARTIEPRQTWAT